MHNQEIACDDGKREAATIPVCVVHVDEEDIVPSSTTLATTFLQNPVGMMHVSSKNVQLNVSDGLHIGNDEYVANLCMESASVASSESASESTDLEDEVVPETTTVHDTLLDKKGSEEVYQFKVLVLLILSISAVVVAACVYIFVTKKEKSQFGEKFRTDASKVLDTVGNSIDRTMIAMDNLAVDLVSYARATNSTWPCVTLPNFALRMSKILPQTDAIVIQFLPIVKPIQRKKWEHYVSHNYFWLNETMAIQENWDGFYGPIGYNWERNDVIWGDSGDIEANVRYVSQAGGGDSLTIESLEHTCTQHFSLFRNI
jgi:hypothetical protein